MKLTRDGSPESEIAMLNAILEAVEDALAGREPSDFMLSFPIVRTAWDLKHLVDVGGLTEKGRQG